MCGHINSFPDWSFAGWAPGKRNKGPPAPDPAVVDQQQASIAASEAMAALNRRRAASSLSAGSRGIIGQRSVLGAAGAITSTGGSVLGAAGGAAGGSAGAGGGR